MSEKIKNIKAHEILTSGGSPTVEAEVELENGLRARASVPYGASAGVHEAVVLLDNDKRRYNGRGMIKACRNIESTIAKKLIGLPISSQQKIDQVMIKLDGTDNKKRLGGNSILAVSLACARTAALANQVPLYAYIRKTYKLNYKDWNMPKPMMVVMEGGKHADNSTDFQEYLFSVNGAPNIKEAVRWGEEAYQALKSILKEQSMSTTVGNEGAFAPSGVKTNEEPLGYLVSAIKKAGYQPGKDISISLDPAASEIFDAKEKQYILKQEQASLSSDQMTGLFYDWLQKYPIISIEDPLAEDDWLGWQHLFKKCGGLARVIGDDLTVTNISRLKTAIDKKSINAVLIKLNQIGSLSETVETIKLGQQEGFWQVVSHRGGGETNDSFMIDLAAAVNAEYVKVGPVRGERTSKYNRLMEIEQEINGK